MAGTKTAKLAIVIAGDDKGAKKAIHQTEQGLTHLQGSLKKVAAGAAGAFSIGAITAFGKKAVSDAEAYALSIGKIQRLTGASAKESSLLAFGAQQAGVSAEKASAAFGILATNIQNGKVAAAGIATEDGNGNLLSFDRIIQNISEHLGKIPAGYKRTAEARKLFGRGGADLAKILGQDQAALTKEMQAYGLEFNEAGLKKYTDFIKAQRDMKAQFMGLEIAVANKVVPTLTTLAETVAKIPAPARNTAVIVGGASVALIGLATAAGFVIPALQTTATMLGIKAGAASASAVAAGEDAAATLTEAQAVNALTAAWVTGEPAAAAAIAARQALAAASAESTAATTTSATASRGLASSLGPVVAGVAVAAGLYKGFNEYLSDNSHVALKAGEANRLLGASAGELLGVYGAIESMGKADDYLKIGRESLPALLALRGAVKDAGGDTANLDKAIKQLNTEQERAAARSKEYAGATDGAAAATRRLEKAMKASAAAQKMAALADKIYADKVGLKSAIEDVASATEDLTAAREAEKGNSDEYRSAVQQEQDDLQQLADDQAAVTDAVVAAGEAQKELTQARADAADKVRDLRDEVVKANMAERDSVLALHEAQAEARRVMADPKATKLDKERAQVELLDAQDKAAQATKDKDKAEKEAATATIEGDEGVIAAHKRVEDAQKAIGAAEKKVSDDRAALTADGLAKTKILNDAAETRKVAEDKVKDALFGQAEAFRQIATDSKGPLAGLQAFADALGGIKNASPELQMLFAQYQAILNTAVGKGVGATGRLGIGTSGSGNLGGTLGAVEGAIAPNLGTGGITSGNVDLPDKPKKPRRNFNNPGTTNITVHIAGTSRQHGRMIGAAVGSTIDAHTRRRRG